MRYRQIRQKKGETEKMVEAGFPKCFSKKVGKISEHCNTCIKIFRRLEIKKNGTEKKLDSTRR